MSMYRKNVSKGAALLDAYFGGKDWESRVDTERLDMALWRDCILGQLFLDFERGMEMLELSVGSGDSFENGFNLHPDHPDYHYSDGAEWALLEIAWIDEINARRGLTTDAA